MGSFNLQDFLQALTYNPANPLMYQSVTFFLLFGVFYLLYSVCFNSRPLRNGILLLFSLYFYYKLSGLFVFILIAMATSDYLIGHGMHRSKKSSAKNLLLALSVIINVGALFYYKYTNFLLETWTGIVSPGAEPLVLKIIQPIGISYFVFKTLTYVFDIHREMIEKPEKSWFRYVLFVSFFPNILAGPISKARDLLPQFISKPDISKKALSMGIFLIMLGLIKKIAVADYIAANFVDRIFESPEFFTGLDAFMASYGAMTQLFFDFAGYTDMMVGFGFLMGFTIEHNFNKPFLAGNISEFWRRWHITLYNWLNEYLYQPLAFAWRRWKLAGAMLAVFLTFFISGLWHGAAITFVVWGLLHGTAIAWDVFSSSTRKKVQKKMPKALYKVISIIITFHFLVFTSVLLKAKTFGDALDFWKKMFSEVDFGMFSKWFGIYSAPFLIMIIALILQWLPNKMYTAIFNFFKSWHWAIKALAFAVLVIILYQLYILEAMPFIYIQF
ncbi:MAG: hypothetical protein C0592_12410 [Marinilabiliales bacterium]|nr:MAG: hypothetical protein C0592_12410 [Marinilabiliales bacterium]